MNEMQKSIVLLLVLLPFVYSKYSFSPFEIPKTWAICLVAILSIGSYFYRQKWHQSETGGSKILSGMVWMWSWMIFSSLINNNFWQSWAGNYYRSDGLMTLTALMMIGICFKPNIGLWKGIGWGSLLMSFLTIWFGGETSLYMGNPNFLAGYLAVTLPMTNLIGIFWLVPQLLAIILLQSWGGALTGLLFVAIVTLRNNRKVMVTAMFLVCIGFGWLYRVDQIKQNPQGLVVAEGRERIWRKAGIAMMQKPITGWGWAQFGRVFKQIDWPVHYSADAHVDRTHASLTEYGVAGGIVGLGLYLYVAFKSVQVLLSAKSSEAKMLGLTLILYFVYSQTNVTSVTLDWIFFVGVGEAIRTQLRA